MKSIRTRPRAAALHCFYFGALVIASATLPVGALAQMPESSVVEEGMIVDVAQRGIQLSGTLTLPTTGPGPFPTALLITGSGPQDRDETVAGMKPFRLLAQLLAASGIATLRLDDPGVGDSTGDPMESTIANRVIDMQASLRELGGHSAVDASRIGVIGHSEGALVGAVLGSDPSAVSFVVMLAGPAIPIAELIEDQAAGILRMDGAGEEQIASQRRIQRMTYEAVRTGEGWTEVSMAVEQQVRAAVEALAPEQRAGISDVEAFVATQVTQQLSAAQTAWYRSLLVYEPEPDISEIEAPVLALYGGKDVQVPPDRNASVMERILSDAGHADFRVMTLPDANHLFQFAETGHPVEYATLEPAFLPALAEELVPWLQGRVR
ncbi:MAG TPA: alpha/beta hydrolase [Candidatus Krumholzibacteria bacterium]|nr:alpha/beta hydrolase [Candidatus Krumholzibacteria bacterium]